MKHLISFDVEVNGRIPGKHSMLQLGAVCFDLKGREIAFFVMNLKPLPGAGEDPETMKWWSEQPKEAWERVTKNPVDSKIVTRKFFDWMAQFQKPVLFAAPVMLDGYWLRYYLETYIGSSGFSLFHATLDARSICLPLTEYYPNSWKEWVRAVTECTIENSSPHYALADAREQGQLIFELFKWAKIHLMEE